MKHLLALGLLAGLALPLGGVGPVEAATSNANLAVSATVAGTCQWIVNPGNSGQGTLPSSHDYQNGFSWSLNCASGLPWTVTVNQGLHSRAGSTEAAPLRAMSNGTASLPYTLTQDGAKSLLWGNTGASGATGTGTGGTQYVFFWVNVLGSDVLAAPTGNYSDTVTVTINY